jgi:hypothetical protein
MSVKVRESFLLVFVKLARTPKTESKFDDWYEIPVRMLTLDIQLRKERALSVSIRIFFFNSIHKEG